MIARAITVQDHTWWKWVAAGWFVLIVIIYGPAAERYILPVISKFEIVSIEPKDAGSMIFVNFEKYRSCEYLGLNWDRINPDGTRQRVFINLKPADDYSGSTRPTGRFNAGPWFIGMEPDLLRGHSAATITYRCHPFWITEANVWP